ncbi:MAG: hypothetical protein LAT68_03675 [Cyclobacteriaceae bacterium]|nr:hypothetical protein [Cyclobacteriaceae bacterium]MCH8515409.1 hypothetical protein [Cyclobacteriaceae bacterium]
MYQDKYYIAKTSGFYQEALESYGFARLLHMILNNDEGLSQNIKIIDNKSCYEVLIEDFEKSSFQTKIDVFCKDPKIGFDYLFKESKNGTAKPVDPQNNKELKIPVFDISKEWEVVKNFNQEDKSENSQAPHEHFSIYELFSHFAIEFLGKPHFGGTTQGGAFTRTYLQVLYNKSNFKQFIESLLFLYSSIDNQLIVSNYQKFIDTSFPQKNHEGNKYTYQVLSTNHKPHKGAYNQLTTPTAIKGANNAKLKLSEMSGEPELLREYMKILGTFESMVSIGGNKTMEDYRVYVSIPKDIDLIQQKDIIKKFRKGFYTNSTYKGDIYSSLLFSKLLIEYLEIEQENLFDFDYTPANYIQGFYVCQFMTMKKSPPKKHAPINMAFIELPTFIKATNREKADKWVESLNKLIHIIRSIKLTEKKEETGDTVRGLAFFRDFISSSKLDSFFDFSFWYANYLMKKLSENEHNRQKNVIPFRESLLHQIYNSMNTKELNLTEIIENEGFKAVASAIRKSTVTLQYTPKESRKFDIRYGLAQQLQNKSKSKEDLATFIGEFIGTYNAETGRNAEKNGGKSFRPNVKDEELIQFYTLLNNNPSRLVGALLSSYGFALNKKDAPKVESPLEDNSIEE